jgi:tetratricopeptide (TPR) repeat protein
MSEAGMDKTAARKRPARGAGPGRARAAEAAAALALAAVLALGGCASPGGKGGPKDQARNENDPQYQCDKGMIALKYGLTDEAIRYGNLALELDPNHFNSYNLLGSAYYTRGDFERSVEAYEKAAALKPDVAEVHRNLGLAYVETEQLEKAEAAFRKAFEMSGDAEAVFYLARTAYHRQDYEAALEWALQAIQKDGKKAGFYNLKGTILNQMGRYLEAAGSFQAGLVLDPKDVNLRINLGVAYINNQEPEKALAVLEKVLPDIQDAGLKVRVEKIIQSIKQEGVKPEV